MLLQIMEEGHLSDARGRKVDFRNAIIVMTTNVGAEMIKRQGSIGFDIKRSQEVEERLSYEGRCVRSCWIRSSVSSDPSSSTASIR
jgi:ATP-dependent Clp protease ATP-binding subunit ClpC